MRAVLLKDHDRSTVADAWYAGKTGSPTTAFGSVVLNAPQGGLNPSAVEASADLGARAVFLPTESARNNADVWASHLPEGQQLADLVGRTVRLHAPPIGLLDAAGDLLPAGQAVVDTCVSRDLLVCTGHISADEVGATVRATAQAGGRVLVTHAPTFTGASPDLLDEWARAGALLELVALMCCGEVAGWIRRSYAMDAALIDSVGAEAFVLSSDLGQAQNPSPPDGLCAFIDGLLAEGISDEDISTMTRRNPARALGLPDEVDA
jgi:hypothetical protein